jgi:hypothetical protein
MTMTGKRIVAHETSDGFREALTGWGIRYSCKKCNSYLPNGGTCPTCANNMGFEGSEARVNSSRVKLGDWTAERSNNTNS